MHGHSHELDSVVDDDAAFPDTVDDQCGLSGWSEGSLGHGTEHELAESELRRFRLTTGTLYFGKTRTLQVWQRLGDTSGSLRWAALLHEQVMINYYTWLEGKKRLMRWSAGLLPAANEGERLSR